MNREVQTVRIMLGIYCRDQHGASKALCTDCSQLLSYAEERIAECPYGVDKPVCKQCTVHCYTPVMREAIRQVMRYAGPRLMARHPILGLRHLLRSNRYRKGRSK
jgi:hypothetical protein